MAERERRRKVYRCNRRQTSASHTKCTGATSTAMETTAIACCGAAAPASFGGTCTVTRSMSCPVDPVFLPFLLADALLPSLLPTPDSARCIGGSPGESGAGFRIERWGGSLWVSPSAARLSLILMSSQDTCTVCSVLLAVITCSQRACTSQSAVCKVWRRGGKEARRQGGKEARRQGGKEARRQGGKEARRQGGKEARRQGGTLGNAGASTPARLFHCPTGASSVQYSFLYG